MQYHQMQNYSFNSYYYFLENIKQIHVKFKYFRNSF
jgi:hypothetical protein